MPKWTSQAVHRVASQGNSQGDPRPAEPETPDDRESFGTLEPTLRETIRNRLVSTVALSVVPRYDGKNLTPAKASEAPLLE
jgi:hypothetical protein